MTRAIGVTYLAIWGATAVGAGLAAAGAPLVATQAPRDALDASFATAGQLLLHNVSVALWPLGLVVVGWANLAGVRHVGDLLVAAQVLTHGLVVGSAVGTHPDTFRFLPHLPLEWLGISLPAAAWCLARRCKPKSRTLAGVAVSSIAALAGASVMESFGVPWI